MKSWPIVASAASAVVAALAVVLAIAEGPTIVAPVATVAALFALWAAVLRLKQDQPRTSTAVLEKAAQHAEEGRKLVIYERETGLFAHWYITLRCDEEAYRANRYDQPLTVVAIEPGPNSDTWALQKQIADWLRRELRKADLAAYVGNGRYVVLMPQVGESAAGKVAARLRRDLEGVETGLASYPNDGSTFDELAAAACGGLGQQAETAA